MLKMSSIPIYSPSMMMVNEHRYPEVLLSDAEDEARMLPCRFYVNGFCARGNRCRYYHPVPAAFPLTVQVPHFPEDFVEASYFGGSTVPIGFTHYGHFPPPTSSQLTPYIADADVEMRSQYSNEYSPGGIGEEGDAPQVLPNGVTSTYDNGLVTYNYPPGGLSSGVLTYAVDGPGQSATLTYHQEGEISVPNGSESQTMFRHINWGEFMLPGKSPPPLVPVPLGDWE